MRYDSILDYNAPITYSKTERGYFYETEGYSIIKTNGIAELRGLIHSLIKAVQEHRDPQILREFKRQLEMERSIDNGQWTGDNEMNRKLITERIDKGLLTIKRRRTTDNLKKRGVCNDN